MVTITYVWHDCFVVSTKEAILVFDYWKDVKATSEVTPEFLEEADKSKRLYVFVSHHHKDHFSRDIFEWISLFRDVRFILSKDTAKHCRHILRPDSVYKGAKPEEDQFAILSPGDTFVDNIVEVKAFRSTDIGNSYVVKCKGQNFLHAGDLNAWLWMEESTDEEVEAALKAYNNILNEISEYCPLLDVAMFPVDSRIGKGYATGAKLLLEKINVKRFFPMHFGLGTKEEQQQYKKDAQNFELYANQDRGEYICLTEPYDSFAYVEQNLFP